MVHSGAVHNGKNQPRGKRRRDREKNEVCRCVNVGCEKEKPESTDSAHGIRGMAEVGGREIEREKEREPKRELRDETNGDVEGRENREADYRARFVPQLSPSRCYDCTVCSFGVWHGGEAALMKGVY